MHRVSFEDQEWFLHTHSQRFAEAQFADLEDQPCTATEDFFITALTAILAASPILAVIAFMVI